MTRVVLDASALLRALLLGEPGAEAVRDKLSTAVISAVNYSEVLAARRPSVVRSTSAGRRVDRQGVEVIPLDDVQASVAASLISLGKPLGLSLADRCCLALALTRTAPVLTADRDWERLALDLSIVQIR